MGGKASLIVVLGFATIFGYINFNMTRLTSTAVENMVGYSQISTSRTMANIGANVGLAMLTYKTYPHNRLLSYKKFTTGPFAGCSYTVRVDSVFNYGTAHILLTSASLCTTYLYTDSLRTKPLVLKDSVIIRMDYDRLYSFASFGWMSQNENGVYFTQGDTLWGKVHSNSTINIDQRPVFWGKVTTTNKFNPTHNNAKFFGGNPLTGQPTVAFPTSLSEMQGNATNIVSTRTQQLYVELKAGSSSSNDGYAIISTGGFIGSGGTKVDSIRLYDGADNVIYSSQDVHVKGKLDGRLSIGSGDDVLIEGSTTYEKYPDAYHTDPGLSNDPPTLELEQNDTQDMLGIGATDDVIIPTGRGDITIHAAIFAKNGSFTADDYDCGHYEGRINLIGSICQKTRGAVGRTDGTGYKKSYRFDPRFGDAFSENTQMHPPSFPSYSRPEKLSILNWWEKPQEPLIVKKYF